MIIDIVVILLALGGFILLGLTEPSRMEKRHRQRLKDIAKHHRFMHAMDHPNGWIARMFEDEIREEIERMNGDRK